MEGGVRDGHHVGRKRLRRDMKSCYECKTRKVKCQLSSEDVPICSECLKRGSKCAVYGTDSERGNSEQPSRISVHTTEARLERIESLLMQLIGRQESPFPQPGAASQDDGSRKDPVTQMEVGDHLGNVPVLSLTRDVIMTNSVTSSVDTHDEPPSSAHAQQCGKARGSITKQSLLSVLPAQNIADVIAQATNAWALQLNHPPEATMKQDANASFFDMTAVAKLEAPAIGQCILFLALCIQQLPPDFEIGPLLLENAALTIQMYVSSVNHLILTDEEMACSTEGFACLTLLGVIYINDGRLRKAWIAFRRASDVGRFLGSHRYYSALGRQVTSTDVAGYRRSWLSAVKGDSYVSLLLGLEPGAGTEPFGPKDYWTDPFADDLANFELKLCLVAHDLARRNLLNADEKYNLTECLDAALDRIYNSMPLGWWQRPILTGRRTAEAAREFDYLHCHLWYFLLRSFTHLPYIFRATRESKYAYSRSCCVDASKSIIHLYLAARVVENIQLQCRVIDVVASVVSVTILLLRIHDLQNNIANQSAVFTDPNMNLVVQVVQSLNDLAASGSRETVVKQSIDVLNALLSICRGSSFSAQTLRLTVPYFGTVTISGLKKAPEINAMSISNLTTTPEDFTPAKRTAGKDRGLWQSARSLENPPVEGPFSTSAPRMTFNNSQFSMIDPACSPLNFVSADSLGPDSLWDLEFITWDP